MGIPVKNVGYARAGRRSRVLQTAWLGDQFGVQFFVLATPTFLKARHAPPGTLALFASLSLLWCLRGVLVPPLLGLLPVRMRVERLLHLVLVSRCVMLVHFLVLAAALSGVTDVARLERLLFLSGIVICTLSGVERGLLESASVLTADARSRGSALHLALSGSTGVVLAWIVCNGVVLPVEDRFGIAAAAVMMSLAIALLSVPLLSTAVRVADAQARELDQVALPMGDGGADRRAWHGGAPEVLKRTARLTLVLMVGWIGMDLAWRIAQPLMTSQGMTLTSIGAVGAFTSCGLLALAALAWLRAGKRMRRRIGFKSACETLALFAVCALAITGFRGGAAYAMVGYTALQIGYFCFNVFTTEFLIRYGQMFESPGGVVSAAAVAYFCAHFAVVPILYFASQVPHGYGVIVMLAGIMLLLWKLGVERILPEFADVGGHG
ncbi:hypothetical protein [Burkholderia stabilis]|uniref:hypothetical protein n=1 Tax=Burkholderia stabilis TaxID=95485 RepID=UPI001F4AA656|nr:hypothetical protein [Burkholderia stabilis]